MSLRVDHRLKIILEFISGPKGKYLLLAELDAPYRYVLSSVEDITTAVQIIATALALRSGEGIATLTCVLDLSPTDIKLYLIHLGSLVGYEEYSLNNIHRFCLTRPGLKNDIPYRSYISHTFFFEILKYIYTYIRKCRQ